MTARGSVPQHLLKPETLACLANLDLVARAVVLKHTPRLRFEPDHSVERGNRVLEILAELEKTPPPTPG